MESRIVLEFKKYFIEWNIENDIKKYEIDEEFHLADLREAIIETSIETSIEPILKYFKKSMYLDIWVDICDNSPKYFLDVIDPLVDKIIEVICEGLYYLGEKSIDQFIHSDKLDFEPVIDLETNEVIENKVTATKTCKTLLLILEKLNINKFNEIKSIIIYKVNFKNNNNNKMHELWNNFNVLPDGKLEYSNDIIKNILKFIDSNSNDISLCKNELSELIDILKILNVEGIEKIEEAFNN